MAYCELSSNGKRIEVFFGYSKARVDAIQSIPGAVIHRKANRSHPGTTFWALPLDLTSARELRKAFGPELRLGERIEAWARSAKREESQLRSLAGADSARLAVLPRVLPELYQMIHVGPRGRHMTPEEFAAALEGEPSFQSADVAFGVRTNPLNNLQPGLGKTPETVATIFEAEIDNGPILVVAPKTALEATWKTQLEAIQPHPVFVSTGTKKRKESAIASFVSEVVDPGFAGWLVVNPDQLRFREEFHPCEDHDYLILDAKEKNEIRKCAYCDVKLVSEFPELRKVSWNAIIIDEAHKNMLRNPKSLTRKGLVQTKMVERGKRFVLTGTPMGGKIIYLWGLLNYLNPSVFSSKWRFAEQWTDMGERSYVKAGKLHKRKTIGSSLRHCPDHYGHDDEAEGRPHCAGCRAIEDAFYDMLSPYMIRRTKAECLPWLPPKLPIPEPCGFGSAAHERQYRQFQEEAEVIINGESVSATSVLAEYTRLKQFAFSRHEVVNGKLVPTEDSGKLEAIRQKLEELGVWDRSSDEQVVLFSQFSSIVDVIHRWLEKNDINALKITGSINKRGERDRIQKLFQAGGLQALVMTTTAGGVSIELDMANTVFMVDETWDPDDQEQAEDRCHRASRIHQVSIYNMWTMDTIEGDIAATTLTKSVRNMNVLDLRRLLRKRQRSSK